MTSPQQGRDYGAELYEAQVREADATLQVLAARAQARKAKADMDEISGLTNARNEVQQDIAALKKFAAADYAQTKTDFEQVKKTIDRRVKDLQARIDRANERYSAWDEARERRFNARLDAADAKVKVWKAKVDQAQTDEARQRRNAVATLEEKVALARARSAEARRDRYIQKSQQALEDAARDFDEAFDAAQVKFETS